MEKLSGIIVAMVTPFNDDESISFEKTDRLLDHLIVKGVTGVFILGTNGEAYALSEEEKIAFAKHVIEYVAGRIKVIVGTGLNSTKATINFSQKIANLKPYALSIVAPSFIAPSQEEAIHHYQHIADNVDVPIMIYNMPAKTGINIEPQSVGILSKHPNIIGIKDSSGNIDNLQGYLDQRINSDFVVLAGSDSKILQLLKMGGDGAIAATANFLTDNDLAIYKYYLKGNIDQAEKHQEAIEPLRKILHLGTTPTMLKATLNLSGLDVGPARLPAEMPNDPKQLNQIKEMIQYYRDEKLI